MHAPVSAPPPLFSDLTAACTAVQAGTHFCLWPPRFQWTFWHAAEQYFTPLHLAQRRSPGSKHSPFAHLGASCVSTSLWPAGMVSTSTSRSTARRHETEQNRTKSILTHKMSKRRPAPSRYPLPLPLPLHQQLHYHCTAIQPAIAPRMLAPCLASHTLDAIAHQHKPTCDQTNFCDRCTQAAMAGPLQHNLGGLVQHPIGQQLGLRGCMWQKEAPLGQFEKAR
jgi:hypothetical protein